MNQITTIRDSLLSGFTSGFERFMQFIPALIGAAVVLIVGWIIAGFVAKLIERVLVATRFENAVSKTGASSYFQQAFGPNFTSSHVIATLAKWFMVLVFFQAAANLLAMPQLSALINNIVLFIPNVVVAIVMLVVGALVAQAVGRLVETSTSRAGVGRPKIFSAITRYAILGFAAIAAVNQLGIATNLINILFTGLVASLALAVGLAFGLGGQGVAQEMTRSLYEQSKDRNTQPLNVVSGDKK